MQTATRGRTSSDYRLLCEQVRKAGLLEPRPGYYLAALAATGGALAAGWFALFTIGNSWAALAVAVWLGLAFTQAVFLGHDAGHQQIFGSCRANRWVGLVVGNLLTGLSFGWWVPKHNAHHAHPNQAGRDPDIAGGAIAFTFDVAVSRRGAARWLARWQAWLFFPLLLLEGLSLHVASLRSLAVRRRSSHGRAEAALLAVHAAAYLGAVFWMLSPLKAVVFIAVQQGVFGLYLGCTFAPNHKGMPILDVGTTFSFARRQIVTARNVTGGRWVALLLGGLDFQIEHHLFPSMPRPNLAHAGPIVRAFCLAEGLPYTEVSLYGSYNRALRHLDAVGQSVALAPQA